MAFVKRDVKDRVVQYPRRYQMVEVQPDIFDLVPVTGTVTEAGTAINKAYLQPIEDGLEATLEKTGDGKDVIVTFTEAATEAHIASGEKLSVMFGKILKKFKSIVPVALGGTGANSAADARTNLGVPPTSHAVSDTTHGVGSPTLHGHVKTINALTQSSHVDGTALSAYQGKVLNDKKQEKYTLLRTISMNLATTERVLIPITDMNNYNEFLYVLRGTFSATSTSSSNYKFNIGIDSETSSSVRAILYSGSNLNKDLPLPSTQIEIKEQFFISSNTTTFKELTSKGTLGGTSDGRVDFSNLGLRVYKTNSAISIIGTVYLDVYGFNSL